MIYTSYFDKLEELEENNIFPISICGGAPDWYTGKQYKKLAPKYKFFMEWKENHDNDFYTRCYKQQVLSKLNQHDVIDALTKLLPVETQQLLYIQNCPIWESPDIHIAMICYEKPSDFCHRHLVSDWLQEFNIRCIEWEKAA